jgi:hypothetical protein
MNKFRSLLISIVGILLIGFFFAPITKADFLPLLDYASPELVSHCDKFMERYTGDPDSADIARTDGLQIKCRGYLNISSHPYLAIILGCGGEGEFVLIDSLNSNIVRSRIKIDIPGAWAIFHGDELKDINGDSIPELPIYLSAGAHGDYTCFLSIYVDSLKFLFEANGGYQFFAPVGDVYLVPTEKPNVYDIRVGDWPDSGQSSKSTIYKWNEDSFVPKETLSTPEKK